MTPPIRISDLTYRYPGAEDDTLRIPALLVDGPGLVAVTGPSGAGKSTLMELLAGTLHEGYEGSVEVLGVELRELRRDGDRQRHLRRIGLIPQDFGLLPGRTVREILAQDLTDAQVPAAERGARVESALDLVGLTGFADRPSQQLSGGQRQRVAIARMLARDVDLVIADEPTANLDPALVDDVMELFRDLSIDRAVVIVTHDPAVAARCARTVVLQSTTRSAHAQATTAPPASVSLWPRLAWGIATAVAVVATAAAAVHVTSGASRPIATRTDVPPTRPSASPESTPEPTATVPPVAVSQPTPRVVYVPVPVVPTPLPALRQTPTPRPTARVQPTPTPTATPPPCYGGTYNGKPYYDNWVTYGSMLFCIGNGAATYDSAPQDGRFHQIGGNFDPTYWRVPDNFSFPSSYTENNLRADGSVGQVMWYVNSSQHPGPTNCETLSNSNGSVMYCP